MDPIIITRRFRYAKRLREIINILIKHGFGFLVDSLGLTTITTIRKRFQRVSIRSGKRRSLSMPTRLRILFEELGPTFIKFGQFLSLRPDIVSSEYITEFSKLLEDTSPLPFNELSKVLQDELGEDWRGNFIHFDEIHFKSASLSQVHKAVLKDGNRVVVKIQRPDIRGVIERDLYILNDLAVLIQSRLPELKVYEPIKLVNELTISIMRELDFFREATNTDQLRTQLQQYKETIIVPEVKWKLTTGKVLTTEYIEGESLSTLLLNNFKNYDINKKRLAENLIKSFFQQIFNSGTFHADPHPGNILITQYGKIAIVDCGLLGILDEETKDRLSLIIYGIIRKDYNLVAKEYLRLGFDDQMTDIRRFRRDIASIVERWSNLPLEKIHLSPFIEEINSITRINNLRIPIDMLLLVKTLGTIDAVSRRLYPDVKLFDLAEKPVKKLLKSRISKDVILNKSFSLLLDVLYILENTPENISRLIKNLLKGKVKLIFKHEGLDNLTQTINTVSTRLSLSFIIGSLVIGSSYILTSKTGPTLYEIPLISILGFMISVILGMWLLLNILRSSKFL